MLSVPIDIDCCKNVRVSNCTVNSPFDDAICPKSSFALGYARATGNVTVSDCYVTGNYVVGSVKCGTESNGGFKNITITNCVFEDCQGNALETVDGALPASSFFIRHARNGEMPQVEIATGRPDARPAFWMQDVDGFDGSFLKLPTGASYFRLDAVQGFRTFGSRVVPDKRFDARTALSF